MKNPFICLLLIVPLCSCSYLKYSLIQAEYARIQSAEPGQVNVKHMIDRDTFFLFGKTIDASVRYSEANLAVAAYSNKFKENECVDILFHAGAGTYFGLNLPEGEYTLLALADIDADNMFSKSEIVGRRSITLSKESAPEKVLSQVNIPLVEAETLEWVVPFPIPERPELERSLFYPAGAIRALDDPIFDEEIAVLGMYDPASFLETAPTMFYALEEDQGYKIPVIFVHGIGGSSRVFAPILEQLDRTRYKPWLFYYPSGGDLNQLADFFYTVFLSGKTIPLHKMPVVVVAHSMGGLIVREALNKCGESPCENVIELFVSIASPWGGHPAVASAVKHGLMVLPAWRDVNPNNSFIRELYRKPLPKSVHHLLIYAYHNPDTWKIGENSDGVVPLSSQLHHPAQQESSEQFGFNDNHTAILENQEMIRLVLTRMNRIKNIFPADHLAILQSGGYNLNLPEDYSPVGQYSIGSVGRYFMAVTAGRLKPIFPEQEHFFQVTRGKAAATSQMDKEWLRFLREYPELYQAEIAAE
ncbi:lipase/acyltransferase domain-containing protein [Desulfopila inferna]|mgnify:CR=1 FL=1|uniref:lipase/acyltransferase domain-containing protein n=1 Tax=Desulfopila inferna TaxID=468528 RepID=UPI0019667E2D|nr:alpha/beta fold hydrolase [Desulfopila inferna]MBM9605270.1 hypothetical protein [Desulfopila inferna]